MESRKETTRDQMGVSEHWTPPNDRPWTEAEHWRWTAEHHREFRVLAERERNELRAEVDRLRGAVDPSANGVIAEAVRAYVDGAHNAIWNSAADAALRALAEAGFEVVRATSRGLVTYVLVESLASARQGRTLWFKQMTGIGPMTTADPAERAEFSSEEAARQCPAMWHALSFYEVRSLEAPDA